MKEVTIDGSNHSFKVKQENIPKPYCHPLFTEISPFLAANAAITVALFGMALGIRSTTKMIEERNREVHNVVNLGGLSDLDRERMLNDTYTTYESLIEAARNENED